MSWRIVEWDRARAHGSIRSDVGELAFDGSVALVDDFRAGEAVEVSLRRDGSSYVVTRIAPVAWRAPVASVRARPELEALGHELSAVVRDRCVRLRGASDDRGDEIVVVIDPESYEPERSIVLEGCSFVQMPTVIEDVARISVFDASEHAHAVPEITRGWPEIHAPKIVLRIEPAFFGRAAGYLVASGARVVTRPSRAGA